ncbi:MAG: CPBP family intramembrane metalloprotease, partial [Acidobacteria bacterium]|nr:CPBP family intramembrane metalloprotease [Acidobacteriota bacterium]
MGAARGPWRNRSAVDVAWAGLGFLCGLVPSILTGNPSWGPLAPVVGCAAAFARAGMSGLTWRHFGAGRPPSWMRAALFGAFLWLAMGIVLNAAVLPGVTALTGQLPDLSAAAFLRGNPPALAGALVVAWGSAALGEEILFRGHVMTRLAEAMGGGRSAWASALFIQAALFGLSHAYQGMSGMVVTAAAGLVLGAGFMLARRNVWPAVLAHGLTD